jgi:hypothetical protein
MFTQVLVLHHFERKRTKEKETVNERERAEKERESAREGAEREKEHA